MRNFILLVMLALNHAHGACSLQWTPQRSMSYDYIDAQGNVDFITLIAGQEDSVWNKGGGIKLYLKFNSGNLEDSLVDNLTAGWTQLDKY